MRSRVNSVYIGLGMAVGILLVVALSVPANTTNPTFLQIYVPYTVLAVLGLAVLITIVYIFRKFGQDRQMEREAYLELFRRQSEDNSQALEAIASLTKQQAETIEQALALGAQLVRLKSDGYAALFDDKVAPITDAEAAYWIETEQST